MNIVVQKYGGSSVETIDKIKAVAQKIITKKREGKDLVVVVSAMGKTTDYLISMAEEISIKPYPRELDTLLSIGEHQSIALLALAIHELGYNAVSLTGHQAGIETTGPHGKSRIESIHIKKITDYLTQGKIVIVAGFQGVNKEQSITTLGRGGSDTTAVALAAQLSCPCEIYTDVEGVYSIDPRLFPRARKIREISYENLAEMAALGAKVLDERAIELGKKYKVPIYIADSRKIVGGTYVRSDCEMEEDKITAVTMDDNIIRIKISKVPREAKDLYQVFEMLKELDVDMGMVQSENLEDGTVKITFVCSKKCESLLEQLSERFRAEQLPYPIEKIKDETRISMVGTGIINQAKVLSRILKTFEELDVPLPQIFTSERSLSYFINQSHKDRLVFRIAEVFEL